jgi:hypothetical protein
MGGHEEILGQVRDILKLLDGIMDQIAQINEALRKAQEKGGAG